MEDKTLCLLFVVYQHVCLVCVDCTSRRHALFCFCKIPLSSPVTGACIVAS